MRFTVSWAILALSLASVLPSCAPTRAPGTSPGAETPLAKGHARILTVRPVVPAPLPTGQWPRETRSTPLPEAEYVLRTADGATIAIVQPAAAELRPGQDVTLSEHGMIASVAR